MRNAPLNDTIIIALAQLVDDAQSERRDPSHSDLDFHINKVGLSAGDPKSQGQIAGKAKRLRSVLSWAIEHDYQRGQELVSAVIGLIRGHGGFRNGSPNFVGVNEIQNAIDAFASEGYELTLEGELRPFLLENLSGLALTQALEAYVRRAKRGSDDAALVTGTGKDLLEAVAAHILQQRFGCHSATSNFPTLLGQVFVTLGVATTADPVVPGESPSRKLERSMYELACAINQLRNKQGTGHGRPWLPTVGETEARFAIEGMGIIAERLLNLHAGRR